jgi:hypothetical protein
VISKIASVNKRYAFDNPNSFSFKIEEKHAPGNCNNSESDISKRMSDELAENQNRTSADFGPRVSMAELGEAENVMALKGTIWELFKIKVYRNNLLIMMGVWSFSSFSFFLIPFYIGKTDLNIYLISLSTAIAEIIAAFICLYLTHGYDMRKLLALFLGLTCIGSVGEVLFTSFYGGSSELPEAASYLILYVGIVTAFDLVYLIVNDLFPTIFLATAYGGCNVVGRFISIFSPLVAVVPAPWPMLILIVLSGISAMAPLCLVKVAQKLN